jgi:hypothetical protein
MWSKQQRGGPERDLAKMHQQRKEFDSGTARSTQAAEADKRLRYRRQFLLSRAPITTLSDWHALTIGKYYLYSHPDLEINKLSNVKKSIVLIGYLFDSVDYKKGNSDILREIMSKSTSFQDFILAIKQYAGQYVLIYEDETCLKLVQDALSLREVYYCTERNLIICGSQPNLVATYSSPELGATKNPEIIEFFKNQMKLVGSGSFWVGDGTYYDGIKHLLPNHCLDLGSLSVHRYWPNSKITTLGLDETINRTCSFLQGMMRAVTWRHSVMMAVTAGIDSRTLLAASREIKDKIYFFVNKERDLNDKRPDIWVPRRLFGRLNVPFHVHDVPGEVEAGFKVVFLTNTFFSSERILPTIFNVYFKNHSDKVNILGLGEVGRERLGREPNKLSAYYLAYSLGYKKSKHAVKQCQRWLQEALTAARQYGVNIMTLLYWEQVLGNWGAVGNSESDIAIEEFDPYASHYVYETLLGVDEKSIKGNRRIIFTEMIRKMWPELLEYPINPPGTMKAKAKFLLKKIAVYPVLKKLRYQANHFRYSHLSSEV